MKFSDDMLVICDLSIVIEMPGFEARLSRLIVASVMRRVCSFRAKDRKSRR